MRILIESYNTCTKNLDHTRRFTTSMSSSASVLLHHCFRYTWPQWLGSLLFQIYRVAMAGTYVVVHCRTPPLTTCVPVSPFTSVSLHPHSTKRRHTCSSESHVSRIWGKVCWLMQILTSHCPLQEVVTAVEGKAML